ncbi:hypothetical protein ACLKA6_012348 [Drosophila palustris]
MEKFCFVVPLKWGMLIIAIIDTILSILGLVFLYLEVKKWNCDLKMHFIFVAFHFGGCINLVLSIWDKMVEHAYTYLITGTFRIGAILAFAIFAFIDGWLLVGIIDTIIVILGIFFWICVYFWYSKLKNE